MALLGPLRRHVSPQPAYSPRIPLVRQMVRPVPMNEAFCVELGLSSAQVCMVDLTESAGKRMTLYDTPASAPDAMSWSDVRSAFVAVGLVG